MKKILSRLFSFILLALLFLVIVVPFIFKGEIKDILTEKLNEQLDATVEFSDVSINLFQDFPNLYVNIKDMSVIGKGNFEGKSLYNATSTAFSIDLQSAIDKNTPYQINEVALVDPVIDVEVTLAGQANYDIYTSEESDVNAEESTIQVALSQYSIKNGTIRYVDRQSGLVAATSGLNHSGTGNFTESVFDLETENAIDKLSLTMDGIDYARDWTINGDVNAKVDLDESSYQFTDNVLRINDMDLAYSGSLKILSNDRYAMDMDFNAPSNTLRSILSLIPSIYQDDFASLTASGISSLKGSVHGVYDDGVSYPAIDLDIEIENGEITYPDLPQQIERLNFEMHVDAKNPSWSDLIVHIPQFTMTMGGEQVTGRCNIDDVMGSRDIEAILDGDIDLGMVGKFVEIEDLKTMSGHADTHIELDASYDDIMNQNYSSILFDANIDLQDVSLSYDGYPNMQISDSKIVGSPNNLSISETMITSGSSDAKVQFTIKDPLKYIVANEEVIADLSIVSNRLDVNELVHIDSESSDEVSSKEVTSFEEISGTDDYVENLKLDYTFTAGEFIYDDIELVTVKSTGRFDDETTRIDQLDFEYAGTNYQSDGTLSNVYRYAMYNEPSSADLNLSMDEIDVLAFSEDGEEASTTSDASSIIPVPEGLDATINTNINRLIYDNIEVNNVSGAIKVKDQIASLVGFKGQTLGGEVEIDGDYNTVDIEKPLYNFKYDINILDFQEAFLASDMFKKLAPIAQFIEGSFNSNSAFSGVLGQDLMPDINTLSADGFIETLNSVILDFPVLDKLGNTLGVKELKSYEIKDSRNWFTVTDGAVAVEPFAFTKEEMNFEVSGKHYLDQELDYKIKAEIPREKLAKSNVTNVVNSGLDWIKSQTSAKGINLEIGDYIYLDIEVTGSLTKPNLKIIPTGSGGQNLKDAVISQVVDETDKIKEKVLTKTEQEIERRKKEAEARINEEVDKVTTKAEEKINEEVEKVTEKAKEKVKDIVQEKVIDTLSTVITDKVGERAKEVLDEKVGDVLGDKADEQLDKVKDKLKDIKIFGRNNDDGGE